MNESFIESRKAIANAREALKNGKMTEARKWAERAAELAPQSEDPWLILAAVVSPKESVEYIRKAADLLDQRIYEIGAVMSMEVGKNRMESLGDVAETADLFRYPCAQMEEHDGYMVKMKADPLVGLTSTNTSVAFSSATTGVSAGWVVFNFSSTVNLDTAKTYNVAITTASNNAYWVSTTSGCYANGTAIVDGDVLATQDFGFITYGFNYVVPADPETPAEEPAVTEEPADEVNTGAGTETRGR